MLKFKRNRLKKVEFKPKAKIEKLSIKPVTNFTCFDFATKERKNFIQSVSPLRKDEKMEYAFWWVLALVFGTQMPHERKFNAS